MSTAEIREIILSLLTELGSYVPDPTADIDLTDYLLDSLHFISFIIRLEEKLCIHYPDYLLDDDCITSIDHFSSILKDVVETQMKEGESE